MGKHVAHLQPWSRCSAVGACAGVITCFRSQTAPEFSGPVLFGASWGIARLGSWAGYGTYVLRANRTDALFSTQMSGILGVASSVV